MRATERPSHTLARFPILPVAGLLALTLAVFFGSSDPNRKAGMRGDDLEDMFIPRAAWLAEALRRAEFPAWNPEVGCGIDQFVTLQTAPFYPPMWLYAFLPLPLTMGLLAFGHLLLAASGFYLWLRARGIGVAAALVGASAIAFGSVGESHWPVMLYSLAWIPWLFFLLDRPCRSSILRWAALTFVFAAQLLTGYPQFIVYGGMLFFGYAALTAIFEKSLSRLLIPITAAAAAVLIAGVQLIPAFGYMFSETWRSGRLTADEVHYMTGVTEQNWVSQWARILPKTIENSSKDRTLSERLSFGYLGPLIPIGAVLALSAGRNWRTIYFALAALAGLYLCLGFAPTPLPIYDWISRLPILGSFRTPDRFLLWFMLGGAALASIGLDRLWRGEISDNARRIAIAFLIVLLALRVVMWLSLGGAIPNAVTWTATIVVAAACLSLRGSHPNSGPNASTSRAVLLPLAMLFTLADLWFACGFMCPYVHFPHESFSSIGTRTDRFLSRQALDSLAQRVGHDRIYVAEGYRPVMRTAHLPPFRTLPFYESLMPARHYHASNAAAHDDASRYRHFSFWAMPADPHQRLFDWCSVQLIVQRAALPREKLAELGWQHVEFSDAESRVNVYANPRAVPRAAILHRHRTLPADQILALLAQPAEPNEEPCVYLEQEPALEVAAPPDPAAPATSQPADRVVWIADEPHHLALDLESSVNSLFVLSDSYAPGWTATLDGAPVRILRANYLHRAIELPAGRHRVEFRYNVPRLQAGAACSIAALVGTILIMSCGAVRAANRAELANELGAQSRELFE